MLNLKEKKQIIISGKYNDMDKLTTSLAWLLRAICLINDVAIFTNKDDLISVLITITLILAIVCVLITLKVGMKGLIQAIVGTRRQNLTTLILAVIFFIASVAVANTWLLMIGVAGVIIALLDVLLPSKSKAN